LVQVQPSASIEVAVGRSLSVRVRLKGRKANCSLCPLKWGTDALTTRVHVGKGLSRLFGQHVRTECKKMYI
jgi:hypothetical protein